MPATKSQRRDMVRLPRNDFEALLEQAACRGARKALQQVGLADESAANDVRTLRGLAASLKVMQHAFLKTVARWVAIGLLLLLAGVATKSNFFHR